MAFCLTQLAAPYIKVYLMEGKNCVEKQKTTIARRTLDPLYQQQLYFTESYHGKVLQVTISVLLFTFADLHFVYASPKQV